MDLSFRNWYEAAKATVPFGKADEIRKGFKYKPGTFGVEIEFAVHKHLPTNGRISSEQMRELITRTYIKGVSYPAFEKAVESTVERVSREYLDIFNKAGIKFQYGDSEPFKGIWGVGPDAFLVEVRSPALRMEDVPELLKVIQILNDRGEEFHGGTSAHVHIGVPPDTDSFDLLVVSAMPDEEAIKRDAGPGRKFEPYAKLSDYQHHMLASLFPKDGEYTSEEVRSRFIKDKFIGVNINAFGKHGTVEFRHLSSQILKTPERLVKWIEYFLMLPHLAQKKKQITIQDRDQKYKTFTRLPNGGIKVTSGQSAQTPPEKPEDLRTGEKFKKDNAPPALGDRLKIVPKLLGTTQEAVDGYMRRLASVVVKAYSSTRKASMLNLTGITFSDRTAYWMGLPRMEQRHWITEMNLLRDEIDRIPGEKLSEVFPRLSERGKNAFLIAMMMNHDGRGLRLDMPPWDRLPDSTWTGDDPRKRAQP